MPRPNQKTNEVRDTIRARIAAGAYPPSSRLVEHRIAEELGVSRVPVREALRDLQAEGYTSERPGGGMEVRSYSDAEIDELILLNAMLEEVLAARLARTANPEQVDALRDSVSRAGLAIEVGDGENAVELNARFHDALLEQCLGTITHELLSLIRPRLAWLHRQHSDTVVIHAEHVALVDAIASHDADLVTRLLRAHTDTSSDEVHELRRSS
ncbi:GntR family transcriptional regulator [Gulosibacter chungangensis]|uniref:GntR family transcriptional regulator n=1 Tax=Gulosibacter chungangensis TaxID=979746 RepID=A0A7J5BF93_9MICO|nr:GntR family transcriptional regulator [Gulosibacter chungangensis]KAB1644043.1 GntR family transcriptional regulator [Gulosibacter chungangensis]